MVRFGFVFVFWLPSSAQVLQFIGPPNLLTLRAHIPPPFVTQALSIQAAKKAGRLSIARKLALDGTLVQETPGCRDAL